MAAAGVLNGAATAEDQPRSTTTDSVVAQAHPRREQSKEQSRSTGPRSQAGKDKVRLNGLKHGMTARSTVLPGEDPVLFEAARRQLHDDLAPRDPLEAILVDRIAVATWQANRDDQVARARRESESEHHALEQAAAQNRQAIALSQLLLEDLSLPMPFRTACAPAALEHPAQLVALLESTIPGCDWLLGRLRQLDGYLATPTAWFEIHGFELARLMGFNICDCATDYRAALCSWPARSSPAKPWTLAGRIWLAAIDARVEVLDQAAIARARPSPAPSQKSRPDQKSVKTYWGQGQQPDGNRRCAGAGRSGASSRSSSTFSPLLPETSTACTSTAWCPTMPRKRGDGSRSSSQR